MYEEYDFDIVSILLDYFVGLKEFIIRNLLNVCFN